MKKVFYIIIVIICILFGFLRYYDLANFTDDEGFVTVLSSSTRYLILIIPLLLALIFAVIYSQKDLPANNSSIVAFAMCIVGIIHIVCGVFSVIFIIGGHFSTIDIILSVSMLMTGLWFAIYGFLSYIKVRLGGGMLFFALIANVFYYVLMLNNYLLLVSSSHRISHTIAILVPMAIVIFFNAITKHLFFVAKGTKFLVFSGLCVFLIAGSIGSAELVHTIIDGTAAAMPSMQALCSVSMGVLGLVCSCALNPSKKAVLY